MPDVFLSASKQSISRSNGAGNLGFVIILLISGFYKFEADDQFVWSDHRRPENFVILSFSRTFFFLRILKDEGYYSKESAIFQKACNLGKSKSLPQTANADNAKKQQKQCSDVIFIKF